MKYKTKMSPQIPTLIPQMIDFLNDVNPVRNPATVRVIAIVPMEMVQNYVNHVQNPLSH
jgi:hypothetical protein